MPRLSLRAGDRCHPSLAANRPRSSLRSTVVALSGMLISLGLWLMSTLQGRQDRLDDPGRGGGHPEVVTHIVGADALDADMVAQGCGDRVEKVSELVGAELGYPRSVAVGVLQSLQVGLEGGQVGREPSAVDGVFDEVEPGRLGFIDELLELGRLSVITGVGAVSSGRHPALPNQPTAKSTTVGPIEWQETSKHRCVASPVAGSTGGTQTKGAVMKRNGRRGFERSLRRVAVSGIVATVASWIGAAAAHAGFIDNHNETLVGVGAGHGPHTGAG